MRECEEPIPRLWLVSRFNEVCIWLRSERAEPSAAGTRRGRLRPWSLSQGRGAPPHFRAALVLRFLPARASAALVWPPRTPYLRAEATGAAGSGGRVLSAGNAAAAQTTTGTTVGYIYLDVELRNRKSRCILLDFLFQSGPSTGEATMTWQRRTRVLWGRGYK